MSTAQRVLIAVDVVLIGVLVWVLFLLAVGVRAPFDVASWVEGPFTYRRVVDGGPCVAYRSVTQTAQSWIPRRSCTDPASIPASPRVQSTGGAR